MMKAMGAVDSFFKVIAGRQIVARRAVEDAMSAIDSRPLTQRSSEEFAELVESYKKHHTREVFDGDNLKLIDPEAIELSETFTFQKAREDNEFFQRLNQLATFPGARLLGITFVKTPAQILKASMNITPGVGHLLRKYDQRYKNGSDYYRAFRDGQLALSNIMTVGAIAGGSQGVLTGAGPLNAEDNKNWRKAGNKPFTLKLPGGGEINYQGLEPATTIIGYLADLGQVVGTGKPELSDVPSLLMSNVINKSFFAQFGQAAKLLTSQDGGGLQTAAGNMIRGLTPFSGFRSQVGKLFDPIIREHRSKIEPSWSWFLKKNLGLGSTTFLPERVDPLTAKPLTRDGFGVGGGNVMALINMFSPLGLQFSKNRTEPIHKKLFDHGVNIDEEMRTMSAGKETIGLTNDEITEFRRLKAGDGRLVEDLLSYFKSDQYNLVDLQTEQEQLAQGLEQNKTAVHQAIMEIMSAYSAEAKSIMRAGYTRTSQGLQQRLQEALTKQSDIEFDARQRSNQLRFNQD